MTQYQLSLHDKTLRPLVVETCLAFIDLNFLEVLIAAFFYSYTYLKLLNMAFIAESILLFC